MSTIFFKLVATTVISCSEGVVEDEGEDEDEGDAFAISKTIAWCYTCVKAMLWQCYSNAIHLQSLCTVGLLRT